MKSTEDHSTGRGRSLSSEGKTQKRCKMENYSRSNSSRNSNNKTVEINNFWTTFVQESKIMISNVSYQGTQSFLVVTNNSVLLFNHDFCTRNERTLKQTAHLLSTVNFFFQRKSIDVNERNAYHQSEEKNILNAQSTLLLIKNWVIDSICHLYITAWLKMNTPFYSLFIC